MIEKLPCPKCGKKTMPKIWNGLQPPVCPNCGLTGKNIKIEYRIIDSDRINQDIIARQVNGR